MNKGSVSLFSKSLAILLILVLLLTTIPVNQFSTVLANNEDEQTEQDSSAVTKAKKRKGTNEESFESRVDKVEELADRRKVNEKTYVNSDLSKTTEIYTSPIHYKNKEGKLKPIKNKLEENDEDDNASFKYKNQANTFSVKFSEKANSNEIVKIKIDQNKLSFSLQNPKNVTAKVQDEKIVYPNLFKDADLRYTVLPEGLKEDIILNSPDSETAFTFLIKGNLIAKQNGHNIEFLDKSDNVVWVMTPPYMEDADNVFSHDISYTLTEVNGKQAITLKVNEDFVKDPERKFPIVVDPTVKIGGTASNTLDTYVMEKYPTYNYYNAVDLRTGKVNSTLRTRSFVKFTDSLPNLNGGLLVKAELKAYQFIDTAPVDTNVNIQKVTSSWSSNTVTWNKQPNFDTSKNYASIPVNTKNAWFTWNITDLVNEWYKGTPNHGFVMRSSKEGTNDSYRKFYSSDNSSNRPYLSITYSDKPSAPTGTAYGNGVNSSSGYVNLKWNSVPGAAGYKVLIFNGLNYEEIDVGNVTSWSTKGKKLWPTASQIASGGYRLRLDGSGTELSDDPRPVYRNSGGKYPNNKNYWFRVKAYNKYGTTAQSDAFTPTIVDQTAPTKPGKPTVTNKLNSSFTFTWSASSDSNSGVKGYHVYMGTAAGKTDIVNGAFVTTNSYKHPNTLPPRTPIYMFVRAVDNQNNYSANSDTANDFARLARDASVVSYSIPTQMEAGSDYNVQITVRNEGLETWTAENGIYLGSKGETDPFTEDTRIPLSGSDSIGTNQTKTFNIRFNGGKKVGNFVTEWGMLKIGTGRFGDMVSREVQVVDTTPPQGSIVINSGQALTNSRNVTLTLTVEDNTDDELSQKIRNEEAAWSPYEPFTPIREWTLSEGNGTKNVSVVFKDGVGNESTAATASIVLDTSYPTAAITSPEELDYLNGAVEIRGSATDNDLKDYDVSYGEGTSPTSWQTIGTGTDIVNNEKLATWNTDGISQGMYTLRLRVTDQAGNTSEVRKYVWIDPMSNLFGSEPYWGMVETQTGFGDSKVNLASGNLMLQYTDASLNGRGLDATIVRTYNSQDASQTMLGKGWRLDLDSSLEIEKSGDVVYIDEDGTRHRFVQKENGGYTAPKGIFKTLTKQSGGTYELRDLDEASLSRTFNAQGKITSLYDKNNNRLTYVYTSGRLTEFVDDVGRKVTLTYSGDRLTQIHSYTGNKVTYSYTDGLLTTVEFFGPNGNSYRKLGYAYDESGKLISATDPNRSTVHYTYNGLRLIHVSSPLTSVNATTGEANQPYETFTSFTYNLTDRKVTVTEGGPSQAAETEYAYNADGNIVTETIDPGGLKIKSTFVYKDHLLTESVNGKGGKTTYTYDSLGNVLTKTDPATKDVENGSYTPVTKYEYKSGTSLVSKETDPLNRVTQYDYDSRGNRTLMVDPEGFKVTYAYDNYGNLIRETSERGPLYGYIPNFSFEEGENASLTGWTTNGGWGFESSDKKSGTRSVKLTGNASLESELIPIKDGRVPVRGMGWVKANGVSGIGVTATVQFHNSSKSVINSENSTPVTGSSDWKLQHVAASVPTGAAFVSYKISLASSAGSALIDDIWLEEANYSTTHTYSSNGLYLTETADPYGKKTTFEYDAAGNVTKETNELGQAARFVYDADNKVIEEIDRLGKKTVHQYDPNGNTVQTTNPLGQVVEYAYDERNNLTVTKHPTVTKTFYDLQTPRQPEIVSVTEIEEYNELGLKVAEKDGNGSITRYEYDKAGRQTRSIDPLRNEMRLSYDANGNTIKEEDMAWDDVTSTLYPKGTTHYNYDELDRMISYSDPTRDKNTLVEKTKYDAAGNAIKTISGTGVTTEYRFDRHDQSIYSKDSSTPAVETWALYDGAGHLAISLDKQGATYEVYDLNGNLKEVIEPEGKKTVYTYNAAGDKLKLVDATGSVTDWEYDAEGQLVKETKRIVDPDTGDTKDQVTQYEYDHFGQVIKQTVQESSGPDKITAKVIELKYDELGRLVKETGISDGKKTESRYYHDNNGNVTHTWIYDETISVPIESDPDGDGFFNSETVSVYDANNRLLRESISHTGTVTTNEFNDKDNEETFSTVLGDTVVRYDNSDRIQQVQTPNFDTFKYTYNVDDMIDKVNAPGVETTLTYNGGSKVSRLKTVQKTSGNAVVDLAYTYSDTEQITQISDKGTVKKKYTYTDKGNLETVEASGKKLKYTYDGNANVTKVENVTTGKTKETYTYEKGDRIKQKKEYNDSTGALIRTTDYTHHPNGSVAKATIKEGNNTTVVEYGYNSDDQLVTINKKVNGQAKPTIVYAYDPDGNRLSRTIGNTQYFYHRDTNGEIFLETKSEGGRTSNTLKYYRDSDGNLLSFSYNEVVYYYQFNARGDVIALTDSAGNVKATYDYDEWGNVVNITGDRTLAEANPYRYVGKYGVMYDQEANLYLMGWRDYDPSIGRFLVPDEYEGEEDEPTSLNRYLYADADPVNNIDPDGYAPKWLQKGWKSTKKAAKKAYNFAVGDDIRTLTSKKSKWYHKAGAAASIASNFIPGVGAAKWAVKGGVKAYKVGKKAKKTYKLAKGSVKKTRKAKLKKPQKIKQTAKSNHAPKKTKKSRSSKGSGKKIHGNSLNTQKPTDVYVVSEVRTGNIIRFGETTQGYKTRGKQHARRFSKLGLEVETTLLKGGLSKRNAKALETRYIRTYKKIFGKKPPYNKNYH